MSASPQFAAVAVNASQTIATANTARDGTGTIATLYTAPANGARIDDLMLKARGTTTAGMIRLFIHDGTNYHLWKEVPVTAITPSATLPSFEYPLYELGLILQSGWGLRVSTEKAESFDVTITRGGTF